MIAVYDAAGLPLGNTWYSKAEIDAALAAIESDLSTHAARTDNPHSVTAAQVGAYSTGAVDTLLSGKADTSHSHAWGTITGTLSGQTDLQSALDAKAPTSRSLSTTGPLSGGGNLSADRTLSIAQANTTTDGYLSATDWNTFNGKQAADATLAALAALTDGTGALTNNGSGTLSYVAYQAAHANLTALAGGGNGTDGYVWTADGVGGFAWEAAAGGGASALDDLTDVVIATPAATHMLAWDTVDSRWENRALVAGDIPNLATSKITGLDTALSGKLATPSLTTGNIPYWDGTAFANSPLNRNASNGVEAAVAALYFRAHGSADDNWIGHGGATSLYYRAPVIHRFQVGGNSTYVNVTNTGLASGLSNTAASAPLHARNASGAQIIGEHSSGNQFALQATAAGKLEITPSGAATQFAGPVRVGLSSATTANYASYSAASDGTAEISSQNQVVKIVRAGATSNFSAWTISSGGVCTQTVSGNTHNLIVGSSTLTAAYSSASSGDLPTTRTDLQTDQDFWLRNIAGGTATTGLAYYDGTNYKSAVEIANVASAGTGILYLQKNAGYVSISAATGRVGFYATTPAAQPAAIADATDAASAITQLNLALAALRTLGLIAT